MVLQVVERALADLQRPGLDLPVGQEAEAGDPAEGRDVLVLLADRLLENVDLDLASLLGQLAGCTRFFMWACSALSRAVVKLPDEPRPVPAGMSAMLVISSRRSCPPQTVAAPRGSAGA